MDIYNTYRNLLDEFIQFKSISTDPAFKAEINKTSSYLKQLFESNSFDVEVIEGFGNPIIVAKYKINPDARRCLIYGHYDIQPANFKDGWYADPFKVIEKDGRLYARGIADNKGQTLIHIATIFELIKENKLKYNITFLMEGDEETSSEKLSEFVKTHKDKLSCDFYMISDGTILQDYPTIERSFRGIVNTEVTIQTSTTELHSGQYGGIVPNAAEEAALLISRLKDEKHWLQINSLNENTDNIPKEILENNTLIPVSKEEMMQVTGTKIIFSDENIDMFTRSSLFTSVEVTGLKSGYIEKGFKNAIPNVASVKLNFRLHPELEPNDFKTLLENHLQRIVPDYVDYTINHDSESKGVYIDASSKIGSRTKKLLKTVYKNDVLEIYLGAIIPVVKFLNDALNVPALIVSLANEDCGMHAVNENFEIDKIQKGIEFSKKFFTM